MPNIWLDGMWLFPFHCGSLYNQVPLLGFVYANLLSSGYVCIYVNMCFNINKMINNSFRFIDGNDTYELVYTHMTMFALVT